MQPAYYAGLRATGGEAFRIVTSGLPRLPGDPIVKRRAWLKENADDVRKALLFEPCGHADMYGGYLTEPTSPTGDFGVIFLHNEGYADHCGHGTIALATAAVWVVENRETGVVRGLRARFRSSHSGKPGTDEATALSPWFSLSDAH